jgi:hypothetical protein
VLTLDDALAALIELRGTMAYAFPKGASCEGGRAYPLYQEVSPPSGTSWGSSPSTSPDGRPGVLGWAAVLVVRREGSGAIHFGGGRSRGFDRSLRHAGNQTNEQQRGVLASLS